MSPLNKLKHYWNRLRLRLNSDYHVQYLRNLGAKIGENSRVRYPSYVDPRFPYLLEIGNNVGISLNVTILTHDASTAFAGDMVKIGRVKINDHCFVGANSTILCNTTIGPDCIIGAGSVVSGVVPPGTVYAGNPARYICDTKEYILKHRNMGKNAPFFESHLYRHPYIDKHKKNELNKALDDGPGYICSKLPGA